MRTTKACERRGSYLAWDSKATDQEREKAKAKACPKENFPSPREVRTEPVSMPERGAARAVIVEEKEIGEETPSVRK